MVTLTRFSYVFQRNECLRFLDPTPNHSSSNKSIRKRIKYRIFAKIAIFLQSKPKFSKSVNQVDLLFEFCFSFAPFSRQQFEFFARSSSHLSLPKIASFLQIPNNFQPNGFKFYKKVSFSSHLIQFDLVPSSISRKISSKTWGKIFEVLRPGVRSLK